MGGLEECDGRRVEACPLRCARLVTPLAGGWVSTLVCPRAWLRCGVAFPVRLGSPDGRRVTALPAIGSRHDLSCAVAFRSAVRYTHVHRHTRTRHAVASAHLSHTHTLHAMMRLRT